MPVFMMALTNPAMYLQCVMKTVGMGQQAGATNARTAGRELVGSTLVGGVLAMLVWGGLTLQPNLWMFALWTAAVSLWIGVRLFRVKATSFPPPYWLNALMTMFFVLGPAIADSANGADVYRNAAMRLTLFFRGSALRIDNGVGTRAVACLEIQVTPPNADRKEHMKTIEQKGKHETEKANKFYTRP